MNEFGGEWVGEWRYIWGVWWGGEVTEWMRGAVCPMGNSHEVQYKGDAGIFCCQREQARER